MTTTAKRILAFLIDLLIITLIAIIFLILIMEIFVRYGVSEHAMGDIWFWGIALLFVFRDTFKIGFGKKVMGLVVKSTKLDDRSQRELKDGTAGWRKMLLRNITLLIWPIELLMLLTNEKRLGDMLAKTIVIKK